MSNFPEAPRQWPSETIGSLSEKLKKVFSSTKSSADGAVYYVLHSKSNPEENTQEVVCRPSRLQNQGVTGFISMLPALPMTKAFKKAVKRCRFLNDKELFHQLLPYLFQSPQKYVPIVNITKALSIHYVFEKILKYVSQQVSQEILWKTLRCLQQSRTDSQGDSRGSSIVLSINSENSVRYLRLQNSSNDKHLLEPQSTVSITKDNSITNGENTRESHAEAAPTAAAGNMPRIVHNGFKNQGATCYLNSALQVLFMTNEFREAVRRLSSSSNDKLLYHLFQLLESLSDGHKPAGVSTVNITKALSIKNVYKQQDAVEWFEKILKVLSPEATKVYKGTLRKTSRCLSKSHTDSQEDSDFFSIPLSINAEKDAEFKVVDGLEDFFQTTRFEKDDWMYCDECAEKKDTEISFNIQKYPTVLILHLKRFYFDYFQMGFQKNSCQMDIPVELNFFQDCPYVLYAIINHRGMYGGGHYDAYIKPPGNDHWYCFDDSIVTEITGNGFLKGSRTAYMLAYRKKSFTLSTGQEDNTTDEYSEDSPNTVAETEEHRSVYVSGESLPNQEEEEATSKNLAEDLTAEHENGRLRTESLKKKTAGPQVLKHKKKPSVRKYRYAPYHLKGREQRASQPTSRALANSSALSMPLWTRKATTAPGPPDDTTLP